MKFKVNPNFVVNRAGATAKADEKGNIETDVPEIIEVLKFLTGYKEPKKEDK